MTPAGIGPTGRLSSLYVLQGKLNFSFQSDLCLLAEEWENEAGTHLARPAFENPADKSPLPSSWPTKVTFWGRGHNWAKGVCSGVTADPTCASAYADPMSGMLFSLWNLISPQGSAQGCPFYETFLEDASPLATAPKPQCPQDKIWHLIIFCLLLHSFLDSKDFSSPI